MGHFLNQYYGNLGGGGKLGDLGRKLPPDGYTFTLCTPILYIGEILRH